MGWSARIEPNPRPLSVWDDEASWPLALEVRANPPSGMMAEELCYFCRVVRNMEAVPTGATYSDAMQVQRWIEKLNAFVETVEWQIKTTRDFLILAGNPDKFRQNKLLFINSVSR